MGIHILSIGMNTSAPVLLLIFYLFNTEAGVRFLVKTPGRQWIVNTKGNKTVSARTHGGPGKEKDKSLEDDDYEYEYEDIKVGNISIHQNSGQRQHKPTGNPAKHQCGMKNVDCQVGNGADYRGGVSQTMSGLKCQAWNVQTPHKHEYGNHYNHHKCRHADDTVGVGCYTTTSKRWELCDVRKCSDCDKECGIENVDCQVGKGGDYRGGVSQTVSGRTCQAWNEQTPHKHKFGTVGNHNQCRNPIARAAAGVWCYTTDPDKRWELCNVPECSNCEKVKELGNGSYSCFHWTKEQEQKIISGALKPEKLCREQGDGFIFSGGDDSKAPGCGTCGCCQPSFDVKKIEEI